MRNSLRLTISDSPDFQWVLRVHQHKRAECGSFASLNSWTKLQLLRHGLGESDSHCCDEAARRSDGLARRRRAWWPGARPLHPSLRPTRCRRPRPGRAEKRRNNSPCWSPVAYRPSRHRSRIPGPLPLSFSPPKAPPISTPDVPILTLAMLQSEPATSAGLRNCRTGRAPASGHAAKAVGGVVRA
jgi:hypothetical protein